MTPIVLRVLRPIPLHVSPESGMPTWEAFQPSSDDRNHAIAREQPVRVSVWDAERVRPERAVEFRGVTPASVFALDTRYLSTIPGPRLGVVPDPDGEPEGLPPEARDAHLGIEGLDRQPGETKGDWKTRLHRVAARAGLVYRSG